MALSPESRTLLDELLAPYRGYVPQQESQAGLSLEELREFGVAAPEEPSSGLPALPPEEASVSPGVYSFLDLLARPFTTIYGGVSDTIKALERSKPEDIPKLIDIDSFRRLGGAFAEGIKGAARELARPLGEGKMRTLTELTEDIPETPLTPEQDLKPTKKSYYESILNRPIQTWEDVWEAQDIIGEPRREPATARDAAWWGAFILEGLTPLPGARIVPRAIGKLRRGEPLMRPKIPVSEGPSPLERMRQAQIEGKGGAAGYTGPPEELIFPPKPGGFPEELPSGAARFEPFVQEMERAPTAQDILEAAARTVRTEPIVPPEPTSTQRLFEAIDTLFKREGKPGFEMSAEEILRRKRAAQTGPQMPPSTGLAGAPSIPEPPLRPSPTPTGAATAPLDLDLLRVVPEGGPKTVGELIDQFAGFGKAAVPGVKGGIAKTPAQISEQLRFSGEQIATLKSMSPDTPTIRIPGVVDKEAAQAVFSQMPDKDRALLQFSALGDQLKGGRFGKPVEPPTVKPVPEVPITPSVEPAALPVVPDIPPINKVLQALKDEEIGRFEASVARLSSNLDELDAGLKSIKTGSTQWKDISAMKKETERQLLIERERLDAIRARPLEFYNDTAKARALTEQRKAEQAAAMPKIEAPAAVERAAAKAEEPLPKIRNDLLPEGWKMEVGRTKFEKEFGKHVEAEVDYVNKRIVFANEEYMRNPDIANHEIAHVLQFGIPVNESDNLFNTYAKVARVPEYVVKSGLHKEQFIVDLGQYLTDVKRLPREVSDFFDDAFSKIKSKGKAEEPLPLSTLPEEDIARFEPGEFPEEVAPRLPPESIAAKTEKAAVNESKEIMKLEKELQKVNEKIETATKQYNKFASQFGEAPIGSLARKGQQQNMADVSLAKGKLLERKRELEEKIDSLRTPSALTKAETAAAKPGVTDLSPYGETPEEAAAALKGAKVEAGVPTVKSELELPVVGIDHPVLKNFANAPLANRQTVAEAINKQLAIKSLPKYDKEGMGNVERNALVEDYNTWLSTLVARHPEIKNVVKLVKEAADRLSDIVIASTKGVSGAAGPPSIRRAQRLVSEAGRGEPLGGVQRDILEETWDYLEKNKLKNFLKAWWTSPGATTKKMAGTAARPFKGKVAQVIHTPEEVLKYDDAGLEGLGRLSDYADEANLIVIAKEKAFDKIIAPLTKKEQVVLGFITDTPDGQLLLPEYIKRNAAVGKRLEKAYWEVKDFFRQLADELGLPEEQRISDYFFRNRRMFETIESKTMRLIPMEENVYRLYLDDLVGNVVSSKRTAGFLKRRVLDPEAVHGAPVNIADMARVYIRGFADTLAWKPHRQRIADLLPFVKAENQEYFANLLLFAKGQKGFEGTLSGIMNKVGPMFIPIQFGRLLGYNLGSAFVNVLDSLRTVAERSMKEIGGGLNWYGRFIAGDKKMRALWQQSGLQTQMSKHELGIYLSPIRMPKPLQKVVDWSAMPFSGSERYVNRASAFFINYRAALNRKLTGDAAMKWAINETNRFHYNYNKVHLPAAFRSPMGRMIGQFKMWPIKTIEFMMNQMAEGNPIKIAKLWGGMIALGGAGVIPGVDLLLDREDVKQYFNPAKSTSLLVTKYGLPSLIGFELGRYMGSGIIPNKNFVFNYLAGPGLSQIWDMATGMTGMTLSPYGLRDMTNYERWNRILRSFPIAGLQLSRVKNMVEVLKNGGEIRDDNGELIRKEYLSEIIMRGMGLPALATRMAAEERNMELEIPRVWRMTARKAADLWANGKQEQAQKLIDKFNRRLEVLDNIYDTRTPQFYLTSRMIKEGIRRTTTPLSERAIKSAPKALRPMLRSMQYQAQELGAAD